MVLPSFQPPDDPLEYGASVYSRISTHVTLWGGTISRTLCVCVPFTYSLCFESMVERSSVSYSEMQQEKIGGVGHGGDDGQRKSYFSWCEHSHQVPRIWLPCCKFLPSRKIQTWRDPRPSYLPSWNIPLLRAKRAWNGMRKNGKGWEKLKFGSLPRKQAGPNHFRWNHQLS